jgi:hypothetical protein
MAYISVLIISQSLKEYVGVAANAAFVLGLTAGGQLPDTTFGRPVCDGDGLEHAGLTCIAHHVRKASGNKLASLRRELASYPEMVVVDYPDAAAPSDYATYTQALVGQKGEAVTYRAVYAYGPEEVLAPLTRNLSRM